LAERRIDVTVEQLFWCQMDILLERGNKENHLSFAFQKSELLYDTTRQLVTTPS
jgi:hypothetical protein